jgi:hypothetical protein
VSVGAALRTITSEEAISPDLKVLIWSTALTLLQVVIAALGTVLQIGLPVIAGNRKNLAAIEGPIRTRSVIS